MSITPEVLFEERKERLVADLQRLMTAIEKADDIRPYTLTLGVESFCDGNVEMDDDGNVWETRKRTGWQEASLTIRWFNKSREDVRK